MDFGTFLREAPEESAPSNTRVRISEDELRRRLEFYEQHAEGFEATDEHLQALVAIFHEHRNVFVTGGAGTGKCLGKGTPVMLADGTTVPVETVKPGDELLGPDGTPRLVISINHGVGPLYRIKCNKGDDFVCNDAHLLTVYHPKKRGGAWHEITAEDFHKLPDHKRKYYLGVRASVEFPDVELPLDPYFVGLWIGDGTLRHSSVRITKPESEEHVHAAVCEQAEAYGLRGKRYNDDSSRCGSSGIISYERGEPTKPLPASFKSAMEELGWNGETKTIPFRYMRSSRSQRLALLAGLIDSDGHLDSSCFEISTKYSHIAKSIVWVARSLGFQATSRLRESTIKSLGFSGMYHRVWISGHTDVIPTRSHRKKAAPRQQVKNPLRFGMTAERIGEGEYYGFEIDGDRRFLLGDFTVTHNTTFIKNVVIPELDFRNLNWSVTATTGIAGSHLNGKTIHSFFGIGLGPDWKPFYPSKMREFMDGVIPGGDAPSPQDMHLGELEAWYAMFFTQWMNDPSIKSHIRQGVIRRLVGHEVLIIDEISMCAGDAMLGYLDYMLKELRGSDKPFGGLQMIFIGDMAQLPPVEKRSDISRPDWTFLSRSWDRGNVLPVELTRVFRQGDEEFIRFLNNIRVGRVTQEDKDYAKQFVRNDMTAEETRLYPFLMTHNDQVRQINAAALQHYPAPTYPLEAEFCIVPQLQTMRDWEISNEARVRAELVKSLGLVEQVTHVRVGMPVMFTSNDPDGKFVNGTRGFVREINLLERTRHESEDLDNVVVGVHGDVVTKEERRITLRRWAFSRAREQDPHRLIPVPLGFNVEHDTLLPHAISMYPTVRQFPLIPAVAVSIHKSQGSSLDRAIIALASSFAPGQVYVGLSRLRSPDGLVLSESDFEVQTDPYVMEYYRSIQERHAISTSRIPE
jgi:hypothetical protein